MEAADVRRYLSLVRGIATRVIARLPSSYELEDLVGAGMLGLLDAHRQFDPDKGVPFERYAEIRVRGAILDELRASDQTPRSSRRQSSELAEVVHELSNLLGHAPSSDEVAGALGIPLAHYQELVARIHPVVLMGFDDLFRTEDSERGERIVYPSDPDAPDPLDRTTRREVAVRLGHAVEQLTPRQRMVVTFHYVEGMSFREIAGFLDVTEGRISQLHTASVTRLRGLLTGWVDS